MSTTKQFSKYGGVAGGSAITDYTTFSAMLFFGAGVLPAQMVARIAGGLFSFILNKYWSFGTKSIGSIVMEGRRFLVLYAFSYGLALGLLHSLLEYTDLGPYPAKIIADVICFGVNFVVMRRYVFSGGQGLRDHVRTLIKPR
jgi:putative flippase GtrA